MPANPTYVLAYLQDTNVVNLAAGTMGPDSPLPGATVYLRLLQSGYEWDLQELEIQGGGFDVVFDQVIDVVWSYSWDPWS